MTPWSAVCQDICCHIAISQSLLKYTPIESVMISHTLLPRSPFAFNLFQHQSLYRWVGSWYQVAKILELHQQSFQWIFRVAFISDWLIWSPCSPRDSQESFLAAAATAAAAKSLQSCPSLCDPRDGSPPGSLILGILQARTLEWVAISFSNAWKWKAKSCPTLCDPWTAAYQAPLSMGFSRQEYWSGVPLLSLFQKDRRLDGL